MDNPREYLDRCHSVAVLGGTFDPIHLGHLAVAESVLATFAPQRVLFVPCGVPPHKEREVSAAEHRYRMALLATCEHPNFDVSRMEIDRAGVSYTIDTARQLLAVCPAGAEIYFIIGADVPSQLLTWKDAEELFRLVRFVVLPRPGFSRKETKMEIASLNARFGERMFLLDMKKMDVSGTTIRHALAQGKSVRAYVPRCVEDYARAHHLYSGAASFDDVKAAIQQRLSPRRFTHTLGVIKEADKLARHYGADTEKTRWAALLHDCAKEYSTDKKHALCKQWGIPVDSTCTSLIELTHGPLGAESAARDYYVTDTEILQAICYHSTGHGNMTLLDKIIMLADFIEPYREDYTPLTQMRKLAYTNMDKALYVGIKYTIKEELQAKNPVHPASYEALDALELPKAAPVA